MRLPTTLDATAAQGHGRRVAFLLAHLTDVHLGPLARPKLRELAGKRLRDLPLTPDKVMMAGLAS